MSSKFYCSDCGKQGKYSKLRTRRNETARKCTWVKPLPLILFSAKPFCKSAVKEVYFFPKRFILVNIC